MYNGPDSDDRMLLLKEKSMEWLSSEVHHHHHIYSSSFPFHGMSLFRTNSDKEDK